MAAEADIIRYMITGEDGEVIPENATHVSVHPSVKVIPKRLFCWHPNIVELVCHDGVIKIEEEAFYGCPLLKRVILKGVEEVEWGAFSMCDALEYVECDKLEIIGEYAFDECRSITSINVPSAKIVRAGAFCACPALVGVDFGRKLESIGRGAFYNCRSLQRITFPLKNGLIIHDNLFQGCNSLKRVDLIDREVLQQTIDALLWEEWKNDMNSELLSIDQILPNECAGSIHDGGKALVIRRWITNVLRKIIYYKVEHRRLLNEAVSRLQLALPHDIVMNNVVPFLTLPHHKFDGEEEINERDDCNESIDETYSSVVDSNEEDEEDNHDGSQGATDTGEEGKQEGANDEERRKRRRTENNGDDVDGEKD